MHNIAVEAEVDPYQFVDEIVTRGEDLAFELVTIIDDSICDLSFSERVRDHFIEVCAKEYAAEAESSKSTTEIPWPMSMRDPARAVHEVFEHGDCGALNPFNCFSVDHRTVTNTIDQYKMWLKHRGVDVDELMAPR